MNDQEMMELAVDEARSAGPATWQNPQVGAVVVKDGQVLSTGHTQPFGGPHAERDAITKLTPDQCHGATLYVTLEPCDHYGKQPPCTKLIIDRQIKRVVVAQVDPHPIVAGKGLATLRQHGIEVVTGVDSQAAEAVNPHYNFFFRHGRPWATIKQAVSLDHMVSAGSGKRTAITNQAVYRRVHRERAGYQASVIGSTTAIVDNPTLTPIPRPAHLPTRVVLDRRGRLADHRDLHLLNDGLAPTWVFTADPQLKDQLGGQVRETCLDDCSIPKVVKALADAGIQSLYVEGGPTIHAAFDQAGMVDEVLTYLSPHLLGQGGVPAWTPSEPWPAKQAQVEQLGDNVRITERKQSNV